MGTQTHKARLTELECCRRVIDACLEMGWKHDELENGTVVLTNSRGGELRFPDYLTAWRKRVGRAVIKYRFTAARITLKPVVSLGDYITLGLLESNATTTSVAWELGCSERTVQRARAALREKYNGYKPQGRTPSLYAAMAGAQTRH